MRHSCHQASATGPCILMVSSPETCLMTTGVSIYENENSAPSPGGGRSRCAGPKYGNGRPSRDARIFSGTSGPLCMGGLPSPHTPLPRQLICVLTTTDPSRILSLGRPLRNSRGWSHALGNLLVPCWWLTTDLVDSDWQDCASVCHE
jgi:hypothetical protein